mgnify:CR=1 FL=1
MILTPQGDLIPDKELPLYSLPSFVDEPIYVKENNYFIEYSNGKLTDYQIDSAVHFSNNGGVYLASRKRQKNISLKKGEKMLGSVIGHVWMLFIESSMNIKSFVP